MEYIFFKTPFSHIPSELNHSLDLNFKKAAISNGGSFLAFKSEMGHSLLVPVESLKSLLDTLGEIDLSSVSQLTPW